MSFATDLIESQLGIPAALIVLSIDSMWAAFDAGYVIADVRQLRDPNARLPPWNALWYFGTQCAYAVGAFIIGFYIYASVACVGATVWFLIMTRQPTTSGHLIR